MLDSVNQALRSLALSPFRRAILQLKAAWLSHTGSGLVVVTLLIFALQILTLLRADAAMPELWLIHTLFYLCTFITLFAYRLMTQNRRSAQWFWQITLASAFCIAEWQLLHVHFALGNLATVALTLNNCLLLLLLSAYSAIYLQNNTRSAPNRRKQSSRQLIPNNWNSQSAAYETVNMYQELHNVTVMFIDMSNFCNLVDRLNASEQHAMLHQFYCEFDRVVHSLGLYRIKTNGDEYIVAGGVMRSGIDALQSTKVPQNALSLCNAALAIRTYFNKTITAYTNSCQLRIGIATGDVVAGRIGRKAVGFDLWGKPMLLASRLESSCIPDHIQICPTTYQQIKSELVATRRGAQALKGLGIVTCYWLLAQSSPHRTKQETDVKANSESL